MPRLTNKLRRIRRGLAAALGLGALLGAGLLGGAQPPRTDQRGEYTLSIDVDLVVLHTTVVDDHGRVVSELGQPSFRVFENNVEQKLTLFRNEDVPITVGLILDNSASMRENRSSMKTGALTFVDTSNPMDEVFLVNFNDDYYLDIEGKDFTNSIEELKTALEKTQTRGSTSFYDAVRASLAEGQTTKDLGGSLGTREVGDWLANFISARPVPTKPR